VYVAVAELGGLPVGRVTLDLRNAKEGIASLQAAHVEPAYQSLGIATALLAHVEGIARQHGFRTMQLGVGKENARARKLYMRLGYEVTGDEVARWTYSDGPRQVEVTEDCWTMRKELRSPTI
jgi:ribosomal protein S18 acetylase RimI-like enzyme